MISLLQERHGSRSSVVVAMVLSGASSQQARNGNLVPQAEQLEASAKAEYVKNLLCMTTAREQKARASRPSEAI
jgi:hypothetical protein